MGAAFDGPLDDGLRRLRIELSPGTRLAIEAQARLLVAWNAAINLTALRRPDQIALGHVIDSLSAIPVLQERLPDARRLVDIGSGGGYPGLPIACAMGVDRADLVDSIGKKARFLAVAAAAAAEAVRRQDGFRPALGARAARAETLAAGRERELWDIVTCRALGSLAEAAELGLPLARIGGLLVAWKRDRGSGTLEAEVRDARPIVREAGGDVPEIVDLTDPALLPGHRLVVIAKRRPTPRRLPRPAAERRRALLR
jgi:16S rRNA (guanine527-N7)-methyltransferase